jgi:predicted transport protein
MPTTPNDRRDAILRGVPEKTGQSVEHWVSMVRTSGIARHMQKIEFLKSQGVGHSTASILVQLAEGDVFEDAPEDQLVALQYGGQKAGLLPIYEAVRRAVTSLGDDVNVEPRRDYVAFARRRQFAVVRPSTATRVDLGLRLGSVSPAGRLTAARNLGGGMIDRKVELRSVSELDGEIQGWLAQAYAGAG